MEVQNIVELWGELVPARRYNSVIMSSATTMATQCSAHKAASASRLVET